MRSLLYALTVLSLPMRGAWIEIENNAILDYIMKSLPMRGAWIEIYCHPELHDHRRGRSPCGERGLKYKKQGYL